MSDVWMKIDGMRGDTFHALRKGWIPVRWGDVPSATSTRNGFLSLKAEILSDFQAILSLVATQQRVAKVVLEIDRPRGAGRIDLFGVRFQSLTMTPPDPLPVADLKLSYERLEFIHVWAVSR